MTTKDPRQLRRLARRDVDALDDFTERERRRLVERTEAAEREHGLQGVGGHEKLGVVRKWREAT